MSVKMLVQRMCIWMMHLYKTLRIFFRNCMNKLPSILRCNPPAKPFCLHRNFTMLLWWAWRRKRNTRDEVKHHAGSNNANTARGKIRAFCCGNVALASPAMINGRFRQIYNFKHNFDQSYLNPKATHKRFVWKFNYLQTIAWNQFRINLYLYWRAVMQSRPSGIATPVFKYQVNFSDRVQIRNKFFKCQLGQMPKMTSVFKKENTDSNFVQFHI